jgi:hypothetical protein
MTATKGIRDRLISIMQSITPVANTTWTVAPRFPRGGAVYEGYVCRVYIRSGGETILASAGRLKSDNQQWVIEVVSPQLGTRLDAEREDALYDYRDLVIAKMQRHLRLEDVTTKVGLTGVAGVELGADTMLMPYQENEQVYALWRLSLTINYMRSNEC